MKELCVFFLALSIFSGVFYGRVTYADDQIPIDSSLSTAEFRGSDVIRIRHLTSPVSPSTYFFVDFKWNPTTLVYEIVPNSSDTVYDHIAVDTESLVASIQPYGFAWNFNWQMNCNTLGYHGSSGLTFHNGGTYNGNSGGASMNGAYTISGKTVTLTELNCASSKYFCYPTLTGTLNETNNFISGTYTTPSGETGCWSAVRNVD